MFIHYTNFIFHSAAPSFEYLHTTTTSKDNWATSWENQCFAYVKTKTQVSVAIPLEADQCLCFCYLDSTIPLLPKSKIFKHLAISSGCTAWFVSDLIRIHIVGFLVLRLNCIKEEFSIFTNLCYHSCIRTVSSPNFVFGPTNQWICFTAQNTK